MSKQVHDSKKDIQVLPSKAKRVFKETKFINDKQSDKIKTVVAAFVELTCLFSY